MGIRRLLSLKKNWKKFQTINLELITIIGIDNIMTKK